MDSFELLQEDVKNLRREERRLYSARVENEVPDELKDSFLLKRAKLTVKRSDAESTILGAIASEEAKTLEQELRNGIAELQKEIDDIDDFAKIIDTLSKVIGLVSSVISIAAPSSIPSIVAATHSVIPVGTMKRAKAAHSPTEELFLKIGTPEVMPKSSADEKAAIAPLEEVLYRVELTPTKLIVTVDAELNRLVEVIFRKG